MDNNKNDKRKNTDVEVDVMAVSLKPSPIFKGQSAKKLVASMEKPVNNSELFKKCKESSKIFKMK